MAKIANLTNVLERRITRGDYTVRDLPTEIEFAEEIGVSRMTARRAFGKLIEAGLVVRKPYGKLTVNKDRESRPQLHLAFLAPQFSSPEFDRWRFALETECKAINAHVSILDYVHWDEPSVSQALSSFDGVFLIARRAEPIPPFVAKRMTEHGRLICLGADLTSMGIPSVQLMSPVHIQKIGDHLHKLGHREIACLNTQPHGDVINGRIEQWNLWKRLHGVTGELFDDPVKPFEPAVPRAYEVMKRRLDSGPFTATAVLCITDAATTGALRAIQERGLRVNQDLSVAGVEGGPFARYEYPSRTSLMEPEVGPYVRACMTWLAQNTPWDGPLLVQSNEVRLFVGESTGPAKRPV